MVSKMNRCSCIMLLSAAVLTVGCASQRKTWVDPASITDQAAYERDYSDCYVLGGQVLKEDMIEQRNASLVGLVGGAVAGAAIGSAITPAGGGGDLTRYGAVAGAAGGAGAGAARLSPEQAANTAVRECLRGRGYHTIR